MSDKLECTCIEAYKSRNMRDPNCCACSCDHNDLVDRLANAKERIAELEKYNFGLAKESHNKSLEIDKANERVKECHKKLVSLHTAITELEQVNNEYAMIIANLVRRADVKTDLLQNTTFEKASVQINKFAIENQIKGIKDLVRVYDSRGNIVIKESDAIEKIEQLRKEQENG